VSLQFEFCQVCSTSAAAALASSSCMAMNSSSSFVRCEGDNPFCLGMEGFCGCHPDTEPAGPPGNSHEALEPGTESGSTGHVATGSCDSGPPEPKRKKLALSLNKRRFQRVDDGKMAAICKGYIPPNTEKNTRWSRTVIQEWKSSRGGDKKCPDDLLERSSSDA